MQGRREDDGTTLESRKTVVALKNNYAVEVNRAHQELGAFRQRGFPEALAVGALIAH